MHRMLLQLVTAISAASAAVSAAAEPVARSASPADHLPSHIRQITYFGERVDFSHDGGRVSFVSKQFGDVMEYDIATGRLDCLSQHFHPHGFVRALYLPDGNLLLTGPDVPFDATDKRARAAARKSSKMFVLDRSRTKPPVTLGYECDEGPAVSRTRMRVAWTHGEQDCISVGELRYVDGVPQLVDVRQVLDVSMFPEAARPTIIETQNFVPPADELLTVTAYRQGLTPNTDVFLFGLQSGRLTNVTNSPELYEECEGIFPDGRSTMVERNEHRGNDWPLADGWRVWFDRSRKPERLTHFLEFPGYKATNYVVSDDGKRMAFQIGKAGDEAGVGYGLFLMDLPEERP